MIRRTVSCGLRLLEVLVDVEVDVLVLDEVDVVVDVRDVVDVVVEVLVDVDVEVVVVVAHALHFTGHSCRSCSIVTGFVQKLSR